MRVSAQTCANVEATEQSFVTAMADLAAVGLKHMEGAYAAETERKRAAGAEAAARNAVTIGIGTADAVRQLLFKQARLRKQNGEAVDGDDIILTHYRSMAAYNSYANEQLRPDKDEQISISAFTDHVRYFWLFAHKWALLEFGGATIERDAFDRDQWTDKGPSSTVYAESSTLEYVLAEDFAESLRVRIPAGKSLNELVAEATEAPAKKPLRRSKKAAPVPAETTEAAETTPPKVKAPARRARRRGRRREDDDNFAPPPKAKAEDDDEIETAVGEAAPTRLNLMVANEVLRRDLAARDEELAAARAEIAAYKEQIKKKEADKKFVEEMTIIPLKKRLAAVRDKLAREMAKNKHLSAAVCPRTSPLCDATNA